MFSSLFRKLPLFKGKRRLANLFIKRESPEYTNVIVKGKFGCQFKVPNIRENIGFDIFVNGVYEKDTIDFIINKIPYNGYIIDVGANIGTIAFPICQVRRDVHVLAIEASPRVFNYLAFNKEINQIKNCNIINKAITETDNEILSFYSPIEKFGKGSLSSTFTDIAEMVETITLNTLICQFNVKKVDLIKIDVEGYEYFAFKGAEDILKSEDAPVIVFEFADWAENLAKEIKPGDAQKLLMDYGYDLYIINENGSVTLLKSPLIQGTFMMLASKQKK